MCGVIRKFYDTPKGRYLTETWLILCVSLLVHLRTTTKVQIICKCAQHHLHCVKTALRSFNVNLKLLGTRPGIYGQQQAVFFSLGLFYLT